ncbi:MAG: arginine--tRNA ligase [Bacteroidales bacterium]|nr:arginine--tRNA ligase [Bacteroidales bacterium]
MYIENQLLKLVKEAVFSLYGVSVSEGIAQVQETRKEFEGDLTLVVFPLLKISKSNPEKTGQEIGQWILQHCPEVDSFNVIKGFLNFSLSQSYWLTALQNLDTQYPDTGVTPRNFMVEYSSPNTNKPLHLGHVRNNLLGYSVSRILQANGHKVVKVNLVNDRGIHICKSMLAWQKFGKGVTPESSGKKGDHLVGDFYVMFDQIYKKEIKQLVQEGMSEQEAEKNAPLLLEAQSMLRRWEAKDPEIMGLWKTMNAWVYDGFDKTYAAMGVDFDKVYYESQTYLHGKEIVQKGLESGVFFRKEDGSVWVDLTDEGLDQKLLLRSDGTSVYMTQDLGTACQRFSEYPLDELIYVVGNEQNYHFQVLALVLSKLGYDWARFIHHMSYGMVELPSGKMKSREGTVVDADDLIEGMIATSAEMSAALGKLDDCSPEEKERIVRTIGLGALKYFILKVDPRKNMLFDPQESIDFNGNTGPFIQYTHARIRSVIRKAEALGFMPFGHFSAGLSLSAKERYLLRLLCRYPSVLRESGENLSPALLANYLYELTKEYNQFYHDYPILHEENPELRNFRLFLSERTSGIIRAGMDLLGIDVPEKM